VFIAGILLFLLGAAALFWYWRKEGGFARTHLDDTEIQEPECLAPAIAGIMAMSAPLPSWHHAQSALYHLANQGILRVRELEETVLWRPDQADYLLEIVQVPEQLSEHEQGVLAMLFPEGYTRGASLKASQLKRAYSKQYRYFADALLHELEEKGFLDRRRQYVRGHFGLICVCSLILALIGCMIGLTVGSTEGIGSVVHLAFGLLGISAIAFFMRLLYSTLSPRGRRQSQRCREFANSLLTAMKKDTGPETFVQYFPYAAGFGWLAAWVYAFQQREALNAPDWYQPRTSGDAPRSFAAMLLMWNSIFTRSNGGDLRKSN
jgi:hypothetical protein